MPHISTILDLVTIFISVLALISSAMIGKKQFELSRQQMAAQNKVELYLLSQPITTQSDTGDVPATIRPAIYVRNIGANVIYLEKYIFNGREYPLGRNVLPPLSVCDAFQYIYLPIDGTDHVSLTINFLDWQNQKWQTTGYADLKNGIWEITYSPCEKRLEK